jgi:glyoxylase-like metal-dependent hydrolase (beta-lactamase superfamily II)
VRLDRAITSGTFSIDGEDFAVENNIWVVGDNREVLVIDAAHDARAILDAVGGRFVRALVCTHGHNDHINAAVEFVELTGAPVLLHPADRMLWDAIHPGRPPDVDLADGQRIDVGDVSLEVLHTPGHSPGGCCLWDEAHGVLFSGDTLFRGGPGATGRSYSSFETIIESITDRLLVLPPETLVHTGHGDDTTIGEEAPHRDEWIAAHAAS